MLNWFKIFSYVIYGCKARTHMLLHSPFVYKWYNAVHTPLDMEPAAEALNQFARIQKGKNRQMLYQTAKYLHAQSILVLDEPFTLPLSPTQKWDFVFFQAPPNLNDTRAKIEALLPHLNTKAVLVLSNFRETKDLYQIWQMLIQNPSFDYSIDFGQLGFLFKVDHETVKQHFILRASKGVY